MPVPKGKEEMYGKVLGHNRNMGKSMEESKAIADRAVKSKSNVRKDTGKKCQACGKVHKHGDMH